MMKLFVFEGKRESEFFDSIQKIFFPKEEGKFIYIDYRSSIYSLYSKLKEYDVFDGIRSSADTVYLLKKILRDRADRSLENALVSDISEIFLFFDYDFQEEHKSLNEINTQVWEMLNFFNNETEAGKLYINYPMIESIRYTKHLPDNNYHQYTVLRKKCKFFKDLANEFSFYKSMEYILISNRENDKEERKQMRFNKAKQNWKYLIKMNVAKANYICTGCNTLPACKSDISQDQIFDSQLHKYVGGNECMVSILNALPIFVYEYFPGQLFFL